MLVGCHLGAMPEKIANLALAPCLGAGQYPYDGSELSSQIFALLIHPECRNE
jgi:hypothetical protein